MQSNPTPRRQSSRWLALLLALAAVMLMIFAAPSFAQTRTMVDAATENKIQYHDRQAREALARWIKHTTKGKTTDVEAKKIVDEAYRYAQLHGLDPLVVLSIMRTESTFRSKVTSRSGAKGLMQVMVKYHRDKIKGRDIYDVAVNTEVGTRIFNDCMVKHNDNLARASRCYTGGGDATYKKRTQLAYGEAKRAVVLHAFENQKALHTSITTARFDTPRVPKADPIELIAISKSNLIH